MAVELSCSIRRRVALSRAGLDCDAAPQYGEYCPPIVLAQCAIRDRPLISLMFLASTPVSAMLNESAEETVDLDEAKKP